MPSKSQAQARLMRAAAHTEGGYGGVPQSVGREFAAADKHREPDADDRGGPSDGDADNKRAKKSMIAILRGKK